MEERLESEMETMTDRVDTAIEKVIEAAVSYEQKLEIDKNVMFDLYTNTDSNFFQNTNASGPV